MHNDGTAANSGGAEGNTLPVLSCFDLPFHPPWREEGRQSFSCVGIKAAFAALPQELENHKSGLQNYIWFRNNEML